MFPGESDARAPRDRAGLLEAFADDGPPGVSRSLRGTRATHDPILGAYAVVERVSGPSFRFGSEQHPSFHALAPRNPPARTVSRAWRAHGGRESVELARGARSFFASKSEGGRKVGGSTGRHAAERRLASSTGLVYSHDVERGGNARAKQISCDDMQPVAAWRFHVTRSLPTAPNSRTGGHAGVGHRGIPFLARGRRQERCLEVCKGMYYAVRACGRAGALTAVGLLQPLRPRSPRQRTS